MHEAEASSTNFAEIINSAGKEQSTLPQTYLPTAVYSGGQANPPSAPSVLETGTQSKWRIDLVNSES